ncbi:MAG: hypothetical protein H7067_07595 [Burkholderiales bacterium]|nr:hypothetical protein [Opitutaceae bacterium]
MAIIPEESAELKLRIDRLIGDLKWFYEQGVRVTCTGRKGTLSVQFKAMGHKTKKKEGA